MTLDIILSVIYFDHYKVYSYDEMYIL